MNEQAIYTEHIYQEYHYKGYEPIHQREEIVRCRDCKHCDYMAVSYLDKPLSVCYSEQWIGAEGDNPLVESDGFCAWGERK